MRVILNLGSHFIGEEKEQDVAFSQTKRNSYHLALKGVKEILVLDCLEVFVWCFPGISTKKTMNYSHFWNVLFSV